MSSYKVSLWFLILFLVIYITYPFSSYSISLNGWKQLPCLSFNCLSSSLNMSIAHKSVLVPNLFSVQLLSFELTPFVFLFKAVISKTVYNTLGLDRTTQSSRGGFFLYAFQVKSRCIKVFAFIGNRFVLILLSLLTKVCNARVFGTTKLPLVWTDDSFTSDFKQFFQYNKSHFVLTSVQQQL